MKTKSCKFAGAKPTPHPPKKGDRSNNCTPGKQEGLQKLVKSNDDLFHGIGKFKGVKVKLHVDPNVQPVAQSVWTWLSPTGRLKEQGTLSQR